MDHKLYKAPFIQYTVVMQTQQPMPSKSRLKAVLMGIIVEVAVVAALIASGVFSTVFIASYFAFVFACIFLANYDVVRAATIRMFTS